MRCLKKISAAIALGASLFLSANAPAADIAVERIWFSPSTEGAMMNADLSLSLNDKLRAALDGGLPLHFVFSLHIFQERKFWLDRAIGDAEWRFTLSHDALTSRFLARGGGRPAAAFSSAESALLHIGELRARTVTDPAILLALAEPSPSLRAAARVELDVGKLPQPLQVEMLADAKWDFSSGWQIFPLAMNP